MRVRNAILLGFFGGLVLGSLPYTQNVEEETQAGAQAVLSLNRLLLLLGGLSVLLFRHNPLVGQFGGLVFGTGIGSELMGLLFTGTL